MCFTGLEAWLSLQLFLHTTNCDGFMESTLTLCHAVVLYNKHSMITDLMKTAQWMRTHHIMWTMSCAMTLEL